MNRFCNEIQKKKVHLPNVQSLKKIKVAKVICKVCKILETKHKNTSLKSAVKDTVEAVIRKCSVKLCS